ncbi:MAG: YhbY family RNA-binding protein [Burkholderiales bacterium]
MLTSKQRSALKAMANSLEPILHVGKAGVTENVIMQADEALTARELIKGTVQQAAPLSAAEALRAIAQATGAEEVLSSGRRFVLYRPRPENPGIRI